MLVLLLFMVAAGLADVSITRSQSVEAPGPEALADADRTDPQAGVPDPEDSLPQARSLSDRAMARMRQGQPEPALRDLQQAMAVLSGVDAPALKASIDYRTGLVLRQLGRNDEALERFRSALSVPGDDPSWLAVLAGNQAGEVLNRLGRHLEALQALNRAGETLGRLDPAPPGSDALRARILANTGVSCFRTGEVTAARDRFQEARGLFESMGAQKEVAVTRLHLANVFMLLGRYPEAEALFREGAEGAKQDAALKERGDALSGLGLLLQYQGRQEEALSALWGAVAAHEAGGDTAGLARDRMNLAAVHINRKQFEEARGQYEIALALSRELRRTPDQGFSMAGLGLTSLLSGRLDRADAELKAALKTLESCECPAELAVALELYGRVQLKQDRLDSADRYFTRARDLAASMGRQETLWRAHAGLGDAASRRGDLRAAADHYLRSVEVIESVRKGLQGPDLQESYLYDKLQVYNELVRTFLLLNEKYDALESLNRRNQWVASRWLGLTPSFDSPRRDAAYKNGRALTARVSAIRQTLRGMPQAKPEDAVRAQALKAKMASADRELQSYLDDLEKTDPPMHGRLAARPLDMRALASRLPDDVAVIAYFLDGPDCHAFSLTGDSLHVSRHPLARGTIEKATASMRDAVRRPPTDRNARESREAFRKASRSLHEMLIAPLAPEVKGKSRWYILPDETLWKVSFNALSPGKGESGERYLAQDHQITLVNTLEDVPRAAGAGARPDGPPELRVAAFGDAEQTLPAAAEEVRLLRRLDPEARIFSGSEATEQNAHRIARDANILVFAAHANRPPASESAHICLAPGDGEDGRLTAGEIRGWDLDHVDLVVLSGCGTALSFDQEQTFLSLADAFLFAGARAVLATLWDISDPGTYQFMERFVRHWSRTRSPAGALRLAQTECIENRPGALARVSPAVRSRYVRVSDLKEGEGPPPALMDLSHPYYWASFVLMEYGPVTSARPAS